MSSKKISRKDIAKMSLRDFLRASREPYMRLASYLKPYRGRFLLGMLCEFGSPLGALLCDLKSTGYFRIVGIGACRLGQLLCQLLEQPSNLFQYVPHSPSNIRNRSLRSTPVFRLS